MERSQLVVGVCIALLLAGAAPAGLWRRVHFKTPSTETPLMVKEVARRFIWYASLAITAGVLIGMMVIGCGGRLVMRLLAVTSGANAQGRVTEVDQIVGVISVDGTIGFVLFIGILGGVGLALLYLLVRRLLPAGVRGGALYGIALITVLGPTVDPLRRNNPDFDIVSPGWLAVATFVLLAVIFGASLAAVIARLSEWLPLPRLERKVLVRYAGPAVVAVFAYSATIVLALVGAAAVAISRSKKIIEIVRSPRYLTVGRIMLLAIVAIAAPYAVISFIDISMA